MHLLGTIKKLREDSMQRTESNPCPFWNCSGGEQSTNIRKTSRKTEGLGCPRMQTCLSANTSTLKPNDLGSLPWPSALPDFCPGQQPACKLSSHVAGTREYYTHHPLPVFLVFGGFVLFCFFCQCLLLFTVHSTFNSVPFIPYSQPLPWTFPSSSCPNVWLVLRLWLSLQPCYTAAVSSLTWLLLLGLGLPSMLPVASWPSSAPTRVKVMPPDYHRHSTKIALTEDMPISSMWLNLKAPLSPPETLSSLFFRDPWLSHLKPIFPPSSPSSGSSILLSLLRPKFLDFSHKHHHTNLVNLYIQNITRIWPLLPFSTTTTWIKPLGDCNGPSQSPHLQPKWPFQNTGQITLVL